VVDIVGEVVKEKAVGGKEDGVRKCLFQFVSRVSYNKSSTKAAIQL
jgi:hypothetical protein